LTASKIVEFSRDLGLQNVMIEGDALKIVNVLRKERYCWSRYGQLIE